ncbi:MAG TPA: hypothetical protein VHV83_10615, partial [Armatimonadota bacterium]|nr:hypothetical protein [Armatimonadota bacterium]
MTATDSANSTRILHIHCGDSSAQVLRESQLPGDVLVWTELLHEGPTPLEVDNETWLHLRASFLASTDHALTADGCLRML